jgi:hypothetical protein
MRNRVLVIVLFLVYGSLVLWLPEITVSPGDLIEGHERIANDCLSCHSPLRGTPPSKCMACHEPDDIGLRTTTGAPILGTGASPRFHQALLEPACARCHSDHLEAGRPAASPVFTHQLLREDVLDKCTDCHGQRTPADDLHRVAPASCGSCHGFEAWTPATFDHAMIPAERLDGCANCHADQRPPDALHREVGAECGGCHTIQAWTPATFGHQQYFRFDRHHPASPCQTCHADSLDRYTCYGCHEHSPRGMAQEHREEGIRDIEDCASCHRSGLEHDTERRRASPGRSRSHDDDDDSRSHDDDDDDSHDDDDDD